MADMKAARERMVAVQLAGRGIRDERVLAAMRAVPRERFVPAADALRAYDDGPLPIGSGQTISQPYVVALMLEAAGIEPGDRVLEVGAGSGYAAAVAAQIAGRVFAIERHATLAAEAVRRCAALGYDNVTVRVGDGTLGWPDAAPFDAILVAAAGPAAPAALKAQLAPGGRLVMPVGDDAFGQSLVRVVRTGSDAWEQTDLGGVRFVPLIGAQGFGEDGRAPSSPAVALGGGGPPALIAAAAEPLPDTGADLGRLVDRFAGCRVVLLGEASHGTAEFYRARAAITRRLVAEHGFGIVAVEADWPDAAAIDRHVRDRPARPGAEAPFRRFPTWMWRNTEVEAFVRWLRGHNDGVADPGRKAGFYGLDLYNMRASIAAVLEYLEGVDPEAARIARERYGCLTPWQGEFATYGRAVVTERYRACEPDVVAQCRELVARELEYAAADGASFLDAAQNARLIASAERYYRTMYRGGAESWNLRDRHMFETLENLLAAGGPEAKAVVWAHNSHVGDARHTAMGARQGELNVGQLCRERFGDAAALVGFGTHTGTVAAASDWGGAMEVMRVRPSLRDSTERLCHDARVPRFLLDLRKDGAARDALLETRLERFIGVIYRPDTELRSHYAEAVLARQFDAWIWFDETTAVTPLPEAGRQPGVPDTYPFGV